MKKIILILAGLTLSNGVVANELSELPELPVSNYQVVGNVTLDNIRYQKVIKTSGDSPSANSMQAMGVNSDFGEAVLFSGDFIKEGMISLPEMLSGSFFVSVKRGEDISELAKSLGMTLTYSNESLGVLKAAEGVELVELYQLLLADKRISTVSIEKVSNKMQPM